MSQLCSCPDPRHCSCNAVSNGPGNSSNYASVQNPPMVHPQWMPGSYYGPPIIPQAGHQVSFFPPTPINTSSQNFGFHNICQATYTTPQNVAADGPESVAFRVALGNTTSNTLNTPNVQLQASTSGKRKQTLSSQVGKSTSSKHRAVPSTASRIGSSVANSELPHQAVPGVGPQAQTQHNRELHPLLARKTGCVGSLLSTGSDSSVSAATDVWYFSIGLTSTNKPTTMPKRTTISDKRPNPKIFPYLGCSLCG